MLQKTHRPFSRREREILKDLIGPRKGVVSLSSTLRWFSLWVGILALCATGAIKAESLPGGPAVIVPIALLVGLVALYSAGLVVSSHFQISRNMRRLESNVARLKADLDHGNASVLSVTATQVAVVEQFEDEGSVYIYDLGDGSCLLLRGDEYEPGRDGPWPARRFEIVRTAWSGWFLGVFGAEEALEPVRTVPMSEMPKSFAFSEEPRSETIIPGSPDEVLRRLGHHA